MINTLELIMSLELGLIYGICAIGVYLTFRIIDFPDLTCDGSFTLGAVLCAVLIKAGLNPLIALAIASAAGAVAGLFTGILHIYFQITNLLSGILVAFMLYSINFKIMGGVSNITLPEQMTILGYNTSLLWLLPIACGICIICSYLIYTDFGLSMRSLGQNKKTAVNYGVEVKSVTIISLAMSNCLIALAGALFAQYQGFADVSQGVGTIIASLAAIVIAEKILPFSYMAISILGCILGSILYRAITAFALHTEVLGLASQDLNLLTALIVISVMFMPKLRNKYAYIR